MIEQRFPNYNDSGTAVTDTVTIAPPGPNSYVLAAIGLSNATGIVSGITGGSGTFVKVAGATSVNRALELWVGYNFQTSYPTTMVVTRATGTMNMVEICRVVDVEGDCTTGPSFVASTKNTATSTGPDCGDLTPATGDILFAACIEASTTADSTVRTSTGNQYLSYTTSGGELTNTKVEIAAAYANAAVASKLVWTLASSVEWAAIQAAITIPAELTPPAALLVKGLETAVQDQASNF